MDILSLSTDMSQTQVQQDAAVRVQKMAMDGAQGQGAALVKMMENATEITDPALGGRVDLLA